LLSTPDQATEQPWVISQSIAPPLPDRFNELLVGVLKNALPERNLFLLLRRKRIQEGLVVTCGIKTTIHTNLFHRLGEAKTSGNHADRSDQTGTVGVDLICCRGYVVGTRCTNIRDHGIDLLVGILFP